MSEQDTNQLRVSVATYNRVLFYHPQSGVRMLALERKATVTDASKEMVRVLAQPFGGAVRILNPIPLQELIGEIKFDSERSERDQDFRIRIHPSKWEAVKQYGLFHLENSQDTEIETLPHRELVEEYEEALHVALNPDQYTVQPSGFVIEDNPVPTGNADAQGQLTVRIYRIFEIGIVDARLCGTMLATSQGYSDRDLAALALQDFKSGNKGYANSILTLPFSAVHDAYLNFAPEMRYQKISVEQHELDETVLSILSDMEVPQYQRI